MKSQYQVEIDRFNSKKLQTSEEVVKWIRSKEFAKDWAKNGKLLKDTFENQFSLTDISPTAYQTQNSEYKALWLLIQVEMSDIKLIAIELQQNEKFPKMSIRVWFRKEYIDQHNKLAAQGIKMIGDKPVEASDSQNLPENDSWRRQLEQKGIEVVGIIYQISNLDFLGDKENIPNELEKIAVDIYTICHKLGDPEENNP